MAIEKRLIDANEFEEAHCCGCPYRLEGSCTKDDPICATINDLREFPAVDAVEVVHGRWLPDMEEFDDDPAVGIRGGVFQTGWKCSICGRSEPAKEPYCNCGAKMDGERKDNERKAD